MQFKTCAKCFQPKELTFFSPTKQQLKFGVRSWCKECTKEYQREWATKNPSRPQKATQKYKASNREKIREWNRQYAARIRKEKPEKSKEWELRARLKRLYGVTPEWRDQTIVEQEGRCAICGGLPGKLGLSIDHDHKTGKARALLCNQCNTGLHKMEQDIEWIRKAEQYLRRFE